jgi:PAS domain S-box-containing protein
MQLYDQLCVDRTGVNALGTLSDYAFVLEQQVHCVVVTDLASHIVGWNKAAETQFGFSKDFMFGRTPTLIYAPKRDQSLADNLFKLACERGHWSSRVRLLSKDGRECYQTRTVAPLYDRGGNLIGGFGTGVPAG